jgi:sialic acid synthase SpsE
LYPTKTEDINLKLTPYLSKIFGLPIGLADHIDGESDLALLLPLLSIPFGARVIEKHLTYDRSKKGEDYESALDAPDFKKFVGYIRQAEKSLGSSFFRKLSQAEIKYRELSRKRVVAAMAIEKGEKMTREKIIFKRATEGIYPNEIRRIVGKKAIINIEEDSPILLKNIK